MTQSHGLSHQRAPGSQSSDVTTHVPLSNYCRFRLFFFFSKPTLRFLNALTSLLTHSPEVGEIKLLGRVLWTCSLDFPLHCQDISSVQQPTNSSGATGSSNLTQVSGVVGIRQNTTRSALVRFTT